MKILNYITEGKISHRNSRSDRATVRLGSVRCPVCLAVIMAVEVAARRHLYGHLSLMRASLE